MECLAVNNVLWMCNCCLNRFYKRRSTLRTDEASPVSSPTFESELKNIKLQVDEIGKMLLNITSQSIQHVAEQNSSTPLSSTKLLDGSGPVYTTNSSPEEIACSLGLCSPPKQIFSLFLTNIESSVSEREVECMVRQTVGIQKEEAINVFKLVPKGKDLSLLDYASFKITLDVKWQTIVMDSATWPPGIKFREFLNTRGVTWSPNHVNI